MLDARPVSAVPHVSPLPRLPRTLPESSPRRDAAGGSGGGGRPYSALCSEPRGPPSAAPLQRHVCGLCVAPHAVTQRRHGDGRDLKAMFLHGPISSHLSGGSGNAGQGPGSTARRVRPLPREGCLCSHIAGAGRSAENSTREGEEHGQAAPSTPSLPTV